MCIYSPYWKPSLSEKEVSNITGISRSTLQRWRKENKGPRFYRAEGRVYYRGEDLLAWQSSATQVHGEACTAG